MTRTFGSHVVDASFDVPDLDIPELDVPQRDVTLASARPPAPSTPAERGVRYEETYLDDPSHDHDARGSSVALALELDGEPRERPTHFVSGVAAPSRPVPRFTSAIPVADFDPRPELAMRIDPPFTPPSAFDVGLDAIRTLPMDLWKRVPAYAFLALVLGNGCKCGGLGAGTNVVLTVLLVIGLVGVAGSLVQRSP